MDIEEIRTYCKTLPHVTEDVKWGNDLCFEIGRKMFCVASLSGDLSVSFKVKDEEFEELSNKQGFMPAPYVARYKWVLVKDTSKIRWKELQHYIQQSYQLVKSKLPKKVLKQLE